MVSNNKTYLPGTLLQCQLAAFFLGGGERYMRCQMDDF